MRNPGSMVLALATGTVVAFHGANAQSVQRASVMAAAVNGAKSQEIEQAVGESIGPNARYYAFTATITGPLNRVNNAAAESSRRGLPLPPDSVMTELSAPHVLIEVKARPPIEFDGAMRIPPRLTNVAIRARDKHASKITPDSVQVYPVEWIVDGSGVKHSTLAIRAFFRPDSVPRGDYEVLVATHRTEEVIPIPRGAGRKVR